MISSSWPQQKALLVAVLLGFLEKTWTECVEELRYEVIYRMGQIPELCRTLPWG